MTSVPLELHGITLNVFCGWGDGPDVGINVERSDDHLNAYARPNFCPLDLTVKEAERLVGMLKNAIDQAKDLDEQYYDTVALGLE